MQAIIRFISKFFRSYSTGVTMVSIFMGAWPAFSLCYIMLDARLRSDFPDDLSTLFAIVIGSSVVMFFFGETATGMLRRLGFKPWFKDLKIIDGVVDGTELISRERFLEKIYDPQAKKLNKKINKLLVKRAKQKPGAKQKKSKLPDVLLPLSSELDDTGKNEVYQAELQKALNAIIKFPLKYGVLVLITAFLTVVVPGAVFVGALLQNYILVLPIVAIGVGYFSTFLFISFELNTGPLRSKLKATLEHQQNIFTFSLRFKFIMQFLIIILSLLALFTMMVYKDISESYSIGFIIVVSILTIFLTSLYIRNILQTIGEIALAVNDLGQGGAGPLYLSSLDREFTNLGNDYTKAAHEVLHYRQDLEVKVKEKTRELEAANEVMVEKDKIIQVELDLASAIQEGLYPQVTEWKDLRFGYFYRPMEKVSGDFFDIYNMPNDKCGLLMADVSGHGVPAALITTMAKLSFTGKCLEHESPAKILDMVNKDLQAHVKTQDYMTAFFVVFDPEYNFAYSNASHQKAILIHTDGSTEELDSKGIFLGADELLFEPGVEHYEEKNHRMEPNERLILFTDGIPEMRSAQNEEFGNERLIKYMLDNKHLPISEVIVKFKKYFFDFIDEDAISDDITILVIDRV